jgi:hypothetical protein
MKMGIIESRHQEMAAEVYDFGFVSPERSNLIVASDGNDPVAGNGDGLRPRNMTGHLFQA